MFENVKSMFNNAKKILKNEKTQDQLLQERIMDNNLICPVCGNEEFNNGIISPASGGGGKVICKEYDTIGEHDINSKYCNKCGYVLMFRKF